MGARQNVEGMGDLEALELAAEGFGRGTIGVLRGGLEVDAGEGGAGLRERCELPCEAGHAELAEGGLDGAEGSEEVGLTDEQLGGDVAAERAAVDAEAGAGCDGGEGGDAGEEGLFDPVGVAVEELRGGSAHVGVGGHGANQHEPGEGLVGEVGVDGFELGGAHEAGASRIEDEGRPAELGVAVGKPIGATPGVHARPGIADFAAPVQEQERRVTAAWRAMVRHEDQRLTGDVIGAFERYFAPA